MYLFADHKLSLFLVPLFCVGVIVSEGKPQSPKKFYAEVASTAEIPCVVDGPKNRLRWYPEQQNRASSRASSHLDQDDSQLFVHVIKDVQLSDAGRYICTDGRSNSRTELVVTEPSPVRDVEVHSNGPDEYIVKWRSPSKNPEAVSGYNIYTTEGPASGKEYKFTLDTVKPDGIEEYPLSDFSPGARYIIQVTALYRNGTDDDGETTEGPRSMPYQIDTPKLEDALWKVMAEPGANNTIVVKWRSPREWEARSVDGFVVYYQGFGKKDAPSGEVEVPAPPTGELGRAVLKGLKLKYKYKIRVAAAYAGGPSSEEVVIALDGFNPELSIRAVALSPDTVLVSLDTVGGNKVDKLRLFYSDNSAIKWDKVEGYNVKEKYAVVSGLQPRTRYFFMAKAAVNRKARSVVTHVLTLPSDLAAPTNVSVTAGSDSSVLVKWDNQEPSAVKGHVVFVDPVNNNGSFRQSSGEYRVVVKGNEAAVQGLQADEKYTVRVEPFGTENVGKCSDPTLFQLSEASQTTQSAQENTPPRFVDDQPEELKINNGDEVRLTCSAIGAPPPMVQWLKNNQSISEPVEHHSNLQLDAVKESAQLTCVANNSAGSVERHTLVYVAPEIERPRIMQNLSETVITKRGGDVQQSCDVAGFPEPTITWLKDGVQSRQVAGRPGQLVFLERRVTRPFNLTCVATNPVGTTQRHVQVYIQELLRKPFLTSHLPRNIEKQEGAELTIPCSFQGNPSPLVTWMDGDIMLMAPALDENMLTINSVDRSLMLTCRGENVAGRTDENVQLRVQPRELQSQTAYQVVLKKVVESPTTVTVRWAVNRGRLRDIRLFDVQLLNHRAQMLINQRLQATQRSMTFRNLLPDAVYTVTLQTQTPRGVADNSSVTFTTRPDQETQSGTEPRIYLDVVEIRDTSARLDFSYKKIYPNVGYTYRLLVKDLGVRNLGNTILTRDRLPLDMTTIVLDKLKPRSRYQATIEASSPGSDPLVSASANFSTPSEGQFGEPVSVVSETQTPQTTSRQPEQTVPTQTSPVVTARTRPTLAVRTLSTASSTADITTVSVTTQPVEEDTSTIESPDSDYTMTAKIPNKTPFKVDIRWTVDRGHLKNVKDFKVTIKGARGQKLLEQTLPENQRYITIQPLSPATKYYVNVKANGPNGVLAESDVDFQTGPADEVQDTSNPVLTMEANEVRDENAKIDWTVLNADPELVKSYRLQVLDGGPGGFELLSQKLHSSSQSLTLQQLQPNKRYHVIVDALGADDSVLMSSSLTFQTAAPNKFGVPVYSSSTQPQATSGQNPRDGHRPESTHQDAPVPVLDLRVQPDRSTSTAVTWSTRNVVPGSVRGYVLRVRANGPDGRLLLQKTDIPLQSSYFKLDGLNTDRLYYLELDAVGPSGSLVLRAATPYTPGRTPTPIEVSSLPGQGEQVNQAVPTPDDRVREDTPVADDPAPELDMDLNPVDDDKVKVNWTVAGDTRPARPINSFRVKFQVNGPDGQVLHDVPLRVNTIYYTISGLQANTLYHIRLEALDKDGRLIQHVASPYLVPPPGHPVQPIRASSASNQRNVEQSTTPTRDRGPNNSELVITKAASEGQNGLLVEWLDVTSASGQTSRNTMVRYAEFKDSVRDPFQIQSVPAGLGRLLIGNLKARSTYGIQVASMATGGQYVRWSKLVLAKTA